MIKIEGMTNIKCLLDLLVAADRPVSVHAKMKWGFNVTVTGYLTKLPEGVWTDARNGREIVGYDVSDPHDGTETSPSSRDNHLTFNLGQVSGVSIDGHIYLLDIANHSLSVTPEQLYSQLFDIYYENDGDAEAVKMDKAIVATLKSLGYEEAMGIFENTTKRR